MVAIFSHPVICRSIALKLQVAYRDFLVCSRVLAIKGPRGAHAQLACITIQHTAESRLRAIQRRVSRAVVFPASRRYAADRHSPGGDVDRRRAGQILVALGAHLVIDGLRAIGDLEHRRFVQIVRSFLKTVGNRVFGRVRHRQPYAVRLPVVFVFDVAGNRRDLLLDAVDLDGVAGIIRRIPLAHVLGNEVQVVALVSFGKRDNMRVAAVLAKHEIPYRRFVRAPPFLFVIPFGVSRDDAVPVDLESAISAIVITLKDIRDGYRRAMPHHVAVDFDFHLVVTHSQLIRLVLQIRREENRGQFQVQCGADAVFLRDVRATYRSVRFDDCVPVPNVSTIRPEPPVFDDSVLIIRNPVPSRLFPRCRFRLVIAREAIAFVHRLLGIQDEDTVLVQRREFVVVLGGGFGPHRPICRGRLRFRAGLYRQKLMLGELAGFVPVKRRVIPSVVVSQIGADIAAVPIRICVIVVWVVSVLHVCAVQEHGRFTIAAEVGLMVVQHVEQHGLARSDEVNIAKIVKKP